MSGALGVLLMDAGLLCVAAGVVSLVKPLSRLGIASRRRGALVAAAGGALMVVVAGLPAPLMRSARRPSSIDRFIPVFQFHELHELRIHAGPERIFQALKTVPADEIHLFRTLTWLRHPRLPWRSAEESILAPAAGKPLLAVATSSGFVSLSEEPEREIVVGTLVIVPGAVPRGDFGGGRDFAALAAPGYAKAVLNFLIEPERDGWCRLSTETRVFATDEATRRRFAAYWRVIYPGSALIRVEWLRAVRRRAERAASPE